MMPMLLPYFVASWFHISAIASVKRRQSVNRTQADSDAIGQAKGRAIADEQSSPRQSLSRNPLASSYLRQHEVGRRGIAADAQRVQAIYHAAQRLGDGGPRPGQIIRVFQRNYAGGLGQPVDAPIRL